MATILGLAMKISADATGVQKSLTPVERALNSLDQQAKTITSSFDRFAGSSSAAAAAQAKAAGDLERLTQQLQTGAITAPEYARAFEELGNAVDAEVASFERAARTIEANLSPLQRYDAEVKVLAQDLEAGRIDQETFDRAVAKATATFTKAESAAQGYGNALEGAGKGNLKFNELSGILSALPGPLGNVAGRLSGLSSAGEGLARVFSGGLSGGLSAIGTSVAGLVNPFTLAAAGVAAFGAAATAVVRGLTTLEDRVEKLGNTANKLGVSFRFIQELDDAAKRSGTSIDAVSGAFGRLQKSVLGVDEESKAAQKALEGIGLTADQLQSLKPEEQYSLIAKSISAIEDPAKRTATAINLFGRSGADLLPFFNNIEKARIDIQRFNGALSDVDRTRIDGLGDAFDAVAVSIQGFGQELLTPFIGITRSISEGLAPAIATFGRNVGAVLDVFSPLTSAIGLSINLFLQFGSTVGNIVGTVLEPFAAAGRTVSEAFDLISQAATSVFGRVNDAVIGFREFFQFEGVAASFRDTFAQIGEVISRVSTIVTTAIGKLGEVIGSTLGNAITFVTDTVSAFTEFVGLSGVIETIGTVIGRVFGSVSSVFSTIANAIGGTVGRLLTMAENFLGIERSAQDASAGVDKVTESTRQLTEEEKKSYAEVQKAVASSGQALDNAIAKAGEFGQAGFNAALEFQNALADLKEQADNNELNAEQYSRGVALATAEFDKQVETLKRVQEETRKAAEEAQRLVDADRQASDALLEQARIAREFGGDNTRAKAAEDALAVEREIARVRKEVAAARDAGDSQAVMNGETRIAQLEKIKVEQQAIADGSAKAAADEAKRLADQDERVNKILGASREQTQLEQQIADVQAVQARTAQELAAARLAGNEQAANAAAAKLSQLDQLQAKLNEEQQAVEQGFGEGFTKAFEQTTKGIDSLIVKAEQFGNVGALAAQALQAGIEQAQQQVRDGILTKETYDREVARQQDLFNQRLTAAQRVEDYLMSRMDERQRAELDATKQLEERKKQAAVNVQAIEAKIFDEQKKLEEARGNNRLKDAKAAQARIDDLKRVQRAEQGIVDGRVQADRAQNGQLVSGFNRTQQLQSQIAQQNDNFLKSFNNAYAGANASLQAANAAAAELLRQEELRRPTTALAQTADIRTQQGQDLVLQLAQNAQDPALIEAKLQTKQLQLIAQGIGQAASNYFNAPVSIVGGAFIG